MSYNSQYGYKKQVTRLMAASSQLLAILMSMLRRSLGGAWEEPRRSLGAAWSEARVWLERYFCPLTASRLLSYSDKASLSQRKGFSLIAKSRFAIFVFLMLILGSGNVWGQTPDYSGVYYIASHGYNKANTETNYYLCPTENWYYYQPESPYYTNEYNGMPFMTTFQCRSAAYHEGDASAALWIIEKKTGTDYYYIKHAANNQYLTYNTEMGNGSNVGRMRLHLEEMADGDNALFQITYVPAVSAYDITTKNSGPDANRKYLNVTGNVAAGNQASLQATGTKKDGPDKINVGGIIGLWTSGANSDVNGRWYLEKAKCKTPVITFDNVTSKVTITSDDDETIYYTTDGNNPDANFDVYSEPFVLNAGAVVKAISKKDGIIDSEIATLTVNKLAMPTITFNEETREVTITAAEDVEIYYTTDDTDPTIEESTAHAASPVVIEHALPSTKIQARAVKSGYINSDVVTKTDIPAKVLTNPTIILAEDEFVYDGSAKEPAITVKDGDVDVSADEYVVTYSNNTNAGTASVTISDKTDGDYQVNDGSKIFTISPKTIGDGNTAAEGITVEMTEDGSLSAVKDGSTTLIENTDYTQETVEEGSDKIITITGKGNYTGIVKGIYASPAFVDPDGGGSEQAAAVYMAKRDLSCPLGISPYIIRKVNPTIGTAVITKLDYIPEDVPVLLLSDDEASGFVASPKDPSTPDVTAQTKNSNLLKVSSGGETVGAAQIYMFYKGEFVLTKAGTLDEGKFFLYNPNYNAQAQTAGSNSEPAPSCGSLQIVFDDETTGISELNNSKIEEKETDVWYTIDGRRLSVKPSKAGIYIHQGQKEYIKRN